MNKLKIAKYHIYEQLSLVATDNEKVEVDVKLDLLF